MVKMYKNNRTLPFFVVAILLVCFSFLPNVAKATSQGPNSPGTGADDAGIGTAAWSNTGNITTSNNTSSIANLNPSFDTKTHYLKATNFGFAIPAGATINGIVVEWQRFDNSLGGANTKDNAIRIVKGGTIGSTDKSSGSTWPASEAYASYGSSADLWGETWTPTDINSSTFGAALSAQIVNASFNAVPNVDYVRITVYYTAGAPANAYWVGGTGNWSDAANHWASSSGGTPGAANLPGATSNVYFDSNSGTGTATIDVDATVVDVNETSSTITLSGASNQLNINGNVTVNGTLTSTSSGAYYQLAGTGKKVYGAGSIQDADWTTSRTIDVTSTVTFNTGIAGSGVTITNNGSVTVQNYFTILGANWVQGSNATLTLIGTDAFSTGFYDFALDASATGNTVDFEGSMNVNSATYYNLNIGVNVPALSSVICTLYGNATVTNALTIGGGSGQGTLDGSSHALTLSGGGVPMVIGSNGGFNLDTSTVNYTGDAATTIADAGYYNLGVGNATTQTGGRTYTLSNDLSVVNSLTVGPSSGSNTQTLNTANHNITLSGTAAIFNMQSKGAFTAGTSTIFITDTSSSNKTFAGGGQTYHDLSITAGGSGAVIFAGSNTFHNFTINPPKTVTFTASTTQTFTGTFSAVGRSGNIITIGSTAASQATLSKSSGTVNADWLNLSYSAATGGATWYAGCNSVDGGNNSGWLWTCNSAPTITSISPSAETEGYPSFTMTVTGTNYVSGSTIDFDGLALTTNYISATQLTATIPSGNGAGTYDITVVNPAPGGGTSNAEPFTVNVSSGGGGSGSITVHKTATGGDGTFSFTTTGSGLGSFSITTINGAGSYIQSGLSPGTYSAKETVPAGWIKTSDNCGTISVTPGTNTDCYVADNFTNQNPVPTITSISPSSKNEGYTGFTMTIIGTNFIPSSSVEMGAFPLSTTYISSTQLTALIQPGLVAGNYSITVVNPTPGGGTSNAKIFKVNSTATPTCNPLPTITSIVPSSKNEGDPGFLLTVNGTNFLNSSVIYFDSFALQTDSTNYLNGKLTATISTTPAPGTYNVTVVNPSICQNLVADTDTKPISVAVSPDGDSIYVANYIGGTVQKFNTSDLSLATTLNTGGNPRFVAVSPDGNYVYLINNSTRLLQKLNASDLSEVSHASTNMSPTGLAISPDGSSVYVANNDGAIQRFSTATLTVVAKIGFGPTPYQIAASPDGNYVYVVNNTTNQLQKFDANNLVQMLPSVSTGSGPTSVVVSPDSSYVYVTSTGSGLLQKFNASNLSLVLSSTVSGGAPTFVSISPDGVYAYVSYQGSSILQKLSAGNFTQVASTSTYSDSYASAVSADGSFVYFADFSASKLQKFNSTLQSDGGTSNPEIFTVNALQKGSLKIVKNTIGGDRTFDFAVTGPSNMSPLVTTTNGTGSSGLLTVNPSTETDSYSVTETVPNGWTFSSARCDNGYVFGVNGVTNVTVTPGQTTTCTFSDTKNNITPNTFIKIQKDAAYGNGTFTYAVTGPISFNASLTTVSGRGNTGSTPASPGTYSITESMPAGWKFGAAGCNDGSGPTGTKTANGVIGVVVISGQTTNCVFGNTKLTNPPNTFLKIIKNTSGGDATFNYTVSGPTNLTPSITTTNGTGISGPTTVTPGTYAISEDALDGWTQTSASCDNGTPNAAVVVPGQTTTCTFSNTEDTVSQTSLKIVKNAIGGDAVFDYSVMGPTNFDTGTITTSGGIGSYGPTPVSAGTYSIEEAVPNGWTFQSVSCDHSYTASNNGVPGVTNVSVAEGETTTCTFTNTKDDALPPPTSLKIIKNTTGGDGSFDYAISGPLTFNQTVDTSGGVGSSAAMPVSAGTYSIAETIPDGWNLDSAVCDHTYSGGDNGITSVVIVPNAVTTCVFGNSATVNPQPAKLKIIKNTSGGDATFNYTVSGPTNLTPSITTTNGTGISGPTTVTPGTYAISEDALDGWTQTSASCDNGTPNAAVVVPGQTTTCTFSNSVNTVGPHIISINPDSKYAGDLPFTLTVNGTGFVPNSIIDFDGLQLTTADVSPIKLTAFISPVPPVGTYSVEVVNPAPGGGTSNSVPFTVNPVSSNGAVYAGNLGISDSACPITDATAISYFYWNYENTNGSAEKKFELQISDQSDYSQPMVDRTFDNLANAAGTQNQQTIQVKLASTDPTTPGCDFINFNKTYYWRVKVWETDANGGLSDSSDWVAGQPYTTIAHPGPYASFGFSPPIPAPDSSVMFSNTSTCYNNVGPVSCTSYAWTFGDNATSGIQNPTHVYRSSGNFMATMQAYDDLGTYCQAQKTVPVFDNTSTNGLPFYREVSPF